MLVRARSEALTMSRSTQIGGQFRQPIVVPRVSREPTMLNRAARRSDGDDQEISS